MQMVCSAHEMNDHHGITCAIWSFDCDHPAGISNAYFINMVCLKCARWHGRCAVPDLYLSLSLSFSPTSYGIGFPEQNYETEI